MANEGNRDATARLPPLIAHVIHHLVIGGLENGLVNLINRMPPHRYRHVIICMTDYSDFSLRILRDDVKIFAMHKKFGKDFGVYARLYRLFRRIRPDLVHSRNLGALDSLLPATLAGVTCKVYGEHGRIVDGPDGEKPKHRWVRILHRPIVNHYVALSIELQHYLHETIGVPQEKITHIHNGVDTDLFHPSSEGRQAIGPYSDPGLFVVGTVGRMQPVKDQLTLVRAMIQLWQSDESARKRLRLVLVGDGPSRAEIEGLLRQEKATDYTWIAGARDDVPHVMRGFDLFVLPSLSEGISNTLLEAMASGLPAVATRVGGNPELIEAGLSGTLVPRKDVESMASAIRAYAENAELCRRHGAEARRAAEQRFAMDVMVNAYMALYDDLLATNTHRDRT